MTLNNYFKAKIPDKFRVETAVPTPGTTELTKVLSVFDGKTIWHYTHSPEEERIITWDMSDADASDYFDRFKDSFSIIVPEKIISMLSVDYDLKFSGSRFFRGKKVYIIKGIAEKTVEVADIESPAMVEYLIGAADGFMYRTRAADSSGKIIASIEYSRVEFNTSIPNSEFTFTPPPDVEVFDAAEIIQELGP